MLQVFADFFDKHDIDQDFYDTFYSQGIDAVFQENVGTTKLKIVKPVPVHTKSQTPAKSVIASIWKKDTRAAKEALSRTIKRITIIKRLTIIRKVNEDIEKVAEDHQTADNGISFKKLVKIFNLCHLFVPLIQVKANNSTYLSLEIRDLQELTHSKDKYKQYVDMQTESLELILTGFGAQLTINSLFQLLARYIIDLNHYHLKPLEAASLLLECQHSHVHLRQLYLQNRFIHKMKAEYAGLVRP